MADSKAAIAAVRRTGRKAHMGILGNEAVDVFAKQATKGVPLDAYEREYIEGGGEEEVIKRAMR